MATGAPVKGIALWCGRLVLAGTFAYAALAKVADPQAFARDIDHYRLLPYPLTLAMAIYLPWLELLCAGAVVCRWRERGALTLLLGLCILFSVALTLAWLRKLDISCGCFGSSDTLYPIPLALARSATLGGIAALLLRFPSIKT